MGNPIYSKIFKCKIHKMADWHTLFFETKSFLAEQNNKQKADWDKVYFASLIMS